MTTTTHTAESAAPAVHRILVATDRSDSADRAVRWAAAMAAGYRAELLVLQVILPEDRTASEPGIEDRAKADYAAGSLRDFAFELAGDRGRAKVAVDADPSAAILRVIEEDGVDVVVVGNVGMAGRKEFLLGNIPNRVSHNARCTVVIVNTSGQAGPAGAPAAGPRFSADADAEAPGRLLARAARIGKVMAKVGLAEIANRRRGEDEALTRDRAQRFRTALDDLGPTFAKLGQILSTRPDLLPRSFIDELATLQDRVTPMTQAEVVSVMEQELGVPWEDVFASIDPVPLAAGTMAEVHRATLENGDRVVVKVQRPTARADILQDLGLLELFAKKTAERPAFRQVADMPAIIEHLSTSLRRELDFRGEAANMKRLKEVLRPYSRLDVPGVYEPYSTARLLVMQEIQGTPIRQAPYGKARTEAARQLLESYYRQIMTEGFFHADPHPGNMMWWNDTIYFLDCGMVGELGPEVREQMMLMLMAFWQEDVNFLSEVVLMLAGEDQRTDIDIPAFQAELGRVMLSFRHQSLKEIQLGPILQEITEISVRHGIRLPASLALTTKALAQMQLATAELDPTLDPFSVAGSFVMKNVFGQVKGGLDPRKLFYEAEKAKIRVTRVIEAVERVTGARPGPKLQVNFRGTERLEESIRVAGRRLSLALAAGGVLLGTSVAATSGRTAKWVPSAMGGLGGALTIGLLADLLRPER